jgi:hypothetical protein
MAVLAMLRMARVMKAFVIICDAGAQLRAVICAPCNAFEDIDSSKTTHTFRVHRVSGVSVIVEESGLPTSTNHQGDGPMGGGGVLAAQAPLGSPNHRAISLDAWGKTSSRLPCRRCQRHVGLAATPGGRSKWVPDAGLPCQKRISGWPEKGQALPLALPESQSHSR